MPVKQQKRKKKKSKAVAVINQVKMTSGWNTTDAEEITRRCLRAKTEPMKVTNLEPEVLYFSNFEVHSKAAQPYVVEIRSLTERINSCSCADYEGNGLGTCKHIEKVLLTLQKNGKRKFKEASLLTSPRTEIYTDASDNQVKLSWTQEKVQNLEVHHLLKGFFSANGRLISPAQTTIPVILRLLSKASEEIRKAIRISNTLQTSSFANFNDFTQKAEAKDFFLQDVADGKYSLEITKLPLYDYQKQGMIHLAFLEKAILADEMGLGKTVQTIAAVELLRKLKGIRKVLVVAPTSLKAEWEEQIAKFVNHPCVLVYGNRGERLRQYQQEAFFYLTNYEQVIRDREEIQRLMAPDVIILDEAQRIKNWRTKTATTIKQLHSPYAFVLTGTPIENRIDDIYSLVQFLYPKLFGSLFRFNREFYKLDDNGKPIGYKNLHGLHERLKPILLRRLKRDVEDQLPDRTINTYFVQMSSEQRSRYEEHESMVARISAAAKKRPLQEEDFKKLQIALANMRMLCDTPYIIDQDCRVCPKLEELETILEELFQDDQTKIIIFSEWERMLHLVGELLTKMNIEFAWHTGSVDQLLRREEINRFKEAKECKVFLSTDSGAVGLNLQAANVVINLDLPWNPAKLEQRIARAWRKHQTRTVQVINLVSEETIEHRMLGVLDLKKRLADTVLDLGTIDEMDLPSGRKAFMEQLSKIFGLSETSGESSTTAMTSTTTGEEKEEINTEGDRDPLLLFQQEVLARFKPRLHQLDVYKDKDENQTIFAVVDGDLTQPNQQMQAILKELDPNNTLKLEVLDRADFDMIHRLCKAGVLQFKQDSVQPLYQSQLTIASRQEEQKKRLKIAEKYKMPIERKEQMTALLIGAGFYEESLTCLRETFELCLKSFAALVGQAEDEKAEISMGMIEHQLVAKKGLPQETIHLALQLQQEANPIDQEKVCEIQKGVQSLYQFIDTAMTKIGLEVTA